MEHIKYLSVFSLIVFSIFFLSCSNINDLNRDGLHGKVKSINGKQYQAVMKNGKWTNDDKLYFHEISIYDNKGYLISNEVFDSCGNLNRKQINKWVNKNKIQENVYDRNGNLSYRVDGNYTKNEIEFTIYDDDDIIKSKGIRYYKNNRLEKMHMEYLKGNKTTRVINILYEYDKQGNISSYTLKDREGKTRTWTYDYISFDDNNNWTKQFIYTPTYKNGKEPKYINLREYEYYE